MKNRVIDILLITLFYGIIYSLFNPADFGFKTSLDPFYYATTTASSVGYGDFTPKTDFAKLVVMSQQLLIITELARMIRII